MTPKAKAGTALLTIALAATLGFASQSVAHGPNGANMPAFEALDADGDGKVTEAELTAHRTAEIAAMDADKDGFISAEEFAAHREAMAQGRAEQRASRMMARLDSNGDGKVSVEELSAGPRRGGMIARLDTDGDGAVSAEEFEAAKARMADGRRGFGMGGHGKGHGQGHGDWNGGGMGRGMNGNNAN